MTDTSFFLALQFPRGQLLTRTSARETRHLKGRASLGVILNVAGLKTQTKIPVDSCDSLHGTRGRSHSTDSTDCY